MGQMEQMGQQAESETSKARLLDELRDEDARWEALLDEIGKEHMTQPGVAGEWSVKDIVAHLTAWRRRTVGRFQAALRHEPEPAPFWPPHLQESQTDDEINAWIYAANRDRPLADVLRESRDVIQQLAETLAAFPAADLRDPARFPWLEGADLPLTGAAFFGHFHEEHESDMRAWLEKIRRGHTRKEGGMAGETDEHYTLRTFFSSWKEYQDHLMAALKPLSAEQLALRAASGLRSVGENALHIVGCRMHWLSEFLGEDGGEGLKAYARWNEAALEAPYASWDEVARALGAQVPPTGGELAQGLDSTWRFMEECLRRWGPAGLRETFPDQDEAGRPIEVSRAWVLWHVLEHDLHHGGEVSLTLGMHGIPAEFAV